MVLPVVILLTCLAVAYILGKGTTPAAVAGRHLPSSAAAAGSHAPSASPAAAGPAPRAAPNVTIPVVKWNAGPGGAALAVVSGQLGKATQAAGLRLFAVMKQACSKLAAAVSAAKAEPPIPDAARQGEYARALASLAQAAAYCEAGISTRPDGDEAIDTEQNGKLLGQSASAFTAGARELYLATAGIRVVSLPAPARG